MRGLFFNAQPTTDVINHPSGFDREYDNDDFNRYMGVFFSNGVFVRNDPDACKVTASGLRLDVVPGIALLDGGQCHFEPGDGVTISQGDGLYSVMCRRNNAAAVRAFELVAIKGVEAYPAPVRDGDIYDLCLAHVQVAGSVSTVADTREDRELCGFAALTGQPPYYPPDEANLPYILWLYILGLPMTEEQRAAVEGNPSLMEIFEQSRIVQAIQLATKEEAEAGVDNSKLMTPRRTKEAVTAQAVKIGQIVHAFYDLETESGGGYLACDGRIALKTSYPELVDKIQDVTGTKIRYVSTSPGSNAYSPTAGAVSDDGLVYCLLRNQAGGTGYVWGGGYDFAFGFNSRGDEAVGYLNGCFYIMANMESTDGNAPGRIFKVDYINKTLTSIFSFTSGWGTAESSGSIAFKRNGNLYFVTSAGGVVIVITVTPSGAVSSTTVPNASRFCPFFVLGDYLYVYKYIYSPRAGVWTRSVIGAWSFSDYPIPRLPVDYTLDKSQFWVTSIGDNQEWTYLADRRATYSQGFFVDTDGSGNARVSYATVTPAITAANYSNGFVTKLDGKFMLCLPSITAAMRLIPNGAVATVEKTRNYAVPSFNSGLKTLCGDASKFSMVGTGFRVADWDMGMAYVPLVAGANLENNATYTTNTAYVKALEGE